MPRTAMRVGRNRPMRCQYCDRVLYLTDFERGLATSNYVMYDTLGGVVDRDEYEHTYDCEAVGRRRIAP